MCFFRKKRKLKKVEFSEYLNKNKTRKSSSLITSFDRMDYTIVVEADDETLYKICDVILSGRAVLANFAKVKIKEANDMLRFISGVVYATEGEVKRVDDKLFLFGRKEEFEDGSLYSYIDDTK